MSTLFGLSAEVIESINLIFSRHAKIQKAIIYGSRAKGNYRTGSDIDLTLIAPGMEYSELAIIENEIDELMLPYKMDLSLFNQIENPNLIDHINRIGKLFFQPS